MLLTVSIGLGDGLTVLNIITGIEYIEYIDRLLRGTDGRVTSNAITLSDQNQIYTNLDTSTFEKIPMQDCHFILIRH